MRIINFINEVLNQQVNSQIVDKTFFCNGGRANSEIGNLKNGQIWSIFTIPQNEQIILDGSVYKENGDYEIYFLTDQIKLDINGGDITDDVTRCLAAAKDFLYKIIKNKTISISNQTINTNIMYSVADRTCCGVKVKATIQTKDGECISEVDGLFIDAKLYNATTNSFDVLLMVESGTKQIKEKGVMYGSAIADTKFIMNNESATIDNLSSDVVYKVKTYFTTNDGNTTYGEEKTIRTKIQIGERTPEVYTTAASDIATEEAILNGVYVKGDIGTQEVGFVWSDENEEPTIDDNKVDVIVEDSGIIQTDLFNLDFDTKYYFRTFIKYNDEYHYGVVCDFTTGEEVIVPAVIYTTQASNIDLTSATFNGVFQANDYDVTELGFCYGTSVNPTIDDNKEDVEIEDGLISLDIEGLTQSTTYHYRAYYIYDDVYYGDDVTLTTKQLPIPLLYASEPSDITTTTAKANGVIIPNGNSLDEVGVCYGETPNPTKDDNYVLVELIDNEFSEELTDLEQNTIYYYRAYCIINNTTYYSADENFSTAEPKPVLITKDASEVTTTSFNVGGVVYPNSYNISESGVVYSKSEHPTVDDNKEIVVPVDYFYNKELTNLDNNTQYYFRTYGISGGIVLYGNEKSQQTDIQYYKLLQYVTTAGGTGIDSGVIPNKYTGFELKFNTNNSTYKQLLGSVTTSNYAFSLFLFNGTSFEYVYGQSQWKNFTYGNFINKDIVLKFNIDNKIYINDVSYADLSSYTISEGSTTVHLFKRNESTGAEYIGKIYYADCYQNNNLFRSFRPCILINDIPATKSFDGNIHHTGEVGFWELNNDKFHNNVGSGSFVPGPEQN